MKKNKNENFLYNKKIKFTIISFLIKYPKYKSIFFFKNILLKNLIYKKNEIFF